MRMRCARRGALRLDDEDDFEVEASGLINGQRVDG